MDIVVLARMSLRRWYVVLVVLGLVVAYALVQYTSAKPVFAAKAQLLVVGSAKVEGAPRSEGAIPGGTPTAGVTGTPTSSDSATATGTPSGSETPSATGSDTPTSVDTSGLSNPLQSVQTTILALVARMQAQPGVVQTPQGAAVYTVAQLNRGGPLLVVSASGSNRVAVRAALEQGIPAVSTSLVALQDDVGAPTDSRFRAVTLQVDSGTSVDYPSRTKGLIVTVVIGLLAALLVAVVVDAALTRRRNRGTRPPVDREPPTARPGQTEPVPVPVTPAGTRARRRARSSP